MSAADIADFLDLMPSTITVEPFTSRDSYGAAVYGTAVSYRAHVFYKNHFVRGTDGELIAARGIIWIATANVISVNDRITLPDGTKPDLLSVGAAQNESGETLYQRVDIG